MPGKQGCDATAQSVFAGVLHTPQQNRGCHLHLSLTVNSGIQADGCSRPDSPCSACTSGSSSQAGEPPGVNTGPGGPYLSELPPHVYYCPPIDKGQLRDRIYQPNPNQFTPGRTRCTVFCKLARCHLCKGGVPEPCVAAGAEARVSTEPCARVCSRTAWLPATFPCQRGGEMCSEPSPDAPVPAGTEGHSPAESWRPAPGWF